MVEESKKTVLRKCSLQFARETICMGWESHWSNFDEFYIDSAGLIWTNMKSDPMGPPFVCLEENIELESDEVEVVS